MSEEISSFADALRYVYGFTDYERSSTRRRDEMKLGGIRALLDALGSPQERFRSVHIAGTKGKGSTAAMIATALVESGRFTGTYSSPHLNTHRERYRLNGEPVSEEDFTRLVRDCRPVIEDVRSRVTVTTFDVITALAFELFARVGVEWAVVEVGLGGRLDSTNVIRPRIAVITSISLDHTEVLGHSLGQIAAEKAGIIKPGVPVVVSRQEAEALEVIRSRAAEVGVPLLYAPELARASGRRTVDEHHQEFELRTSLRLGGRPLDGSCVRLGLLGAHQVENALTAITACAALGEQGAEIAPEALLRALARVRWPGRLEIVPGEVPVVLDGAHNPDSVQKLVSAVRDIYPDRRVTCVFGARLGHDAAEMLHALRGYSLVLCPSTHPRTMPADELASTAERLGLEYRTAGSVAQAIDAARRVPGTEAVLVTGSLFVVADAREALGLAEATDPVRS